MRKITKKNTSIFYKRVIELLDWYGADKEENRVFEISYLLDTNVGAMEVKVSKDLGSIYSIFTQFADPIKAKEKFDCNPYNGKFNFHFNDMDECLAAFHRTLIICKMSEVV